MQKVSGFCVPLPVSLNFLDMSTLDLVTNLLETLTQSQSQLSPSISSNANKSHTMAQQAEKEEKSKPLVVITGCSSGIGAEWSVHVLIFSAFLFLSPHNKFAHPTRSSYDAHPPTQCSLVLQGRTPYIMPRSKSRKNERTSFHHPQRQSHV